MSNQNYFKRLKVNIPLQQSKFLPVQKIGELIQKSFTLVNNGFDYILLDKPQDGTIIIFSSQPQLLPEDGYGWMDNEEMQRFTLENGLVLVLIGHGSIY